MKSKAKNTQPRKYQNKNDWNNKEYEKNLKLGNTDVEARSLGNQKYEEADTIAKAGANITLPSYTKEALQ